MADRKSIGAFWKKTSGKGVEYLSGNITINGVSYPLVVFKNANKESEKHPDYRILLSEPRGSSTPEEEAF